MDCDAELFDRLANRAERMAGAVPGQGTSRQPMTGGWLLDHTDNYRHDGNYGGNACITIGYPCNTVGLVGVLIRLVGLLISPSGKYKRLVLPYFLTLLRVGLPFFGL